MKNNQAIQKNESVKSVGHYKARGESELISFGNKAEVNNTDVSVQVEGFLVSSPMSSHQGETASFTLQIALSKFPLNKTYGGNVRCPNTLTPAAQEMRRQLINFPEEFMEINGGIEVAPTKLTILSQNTKAAPDGNTHKYLVATMLFKDAFNSFCPHGILNGGHTSLVIINFLADLETFYYLQARVERKESLTAEEEATLSALSSEGFEKDLAQRVTASGVRMRIHRGLRDTFSSGTTYFATDEVKIRKISTGSNTSTEPDKFDRDVQNGEFNFIIGSLSQEVEPRIFIKSNEQFSDYSKGKTVSLKDYAQLAIITSPAISPKSLYSSKSAALEKAASLPVEEKNRIKMNSGLLMSAAHHFELMVIESPEIQEMLEINPAMSVKGSERSNLGIELKDGKKAVSNFLLIAAAYGVRESMLKTNSPARLDAKQWAKVAMAGFMAASKWYSGLADSYSSQIGKQDKIYEIARQAALSEFDEISKAATLSSLSMTSAAPHNGGMALRRGGKKLSQDNKAGSLGA